MKFLSLKELHRLPPLPQGKTSAQARYLTATTTAAQRLRAVDVSIRILPQAETRSISAIAAWGARTLAPLMKKTNVSRGVFAGAVSST